jgi:hypothetical protein
MRGNKSKILGCIFLLLVCGIAHVYWKFDKYWVNLKKQPKSPNPINKAAKAKSLGPLQIKYQNISDNIHPTVL